MRPDTKRHLHLGVNFLIAPAPIYGPIQLLRFQQLLAEPTVGVVFDASHRQGEATVYSRSLPPLEVRLGPVGPQVSQILITTQNPERLLEDFIEECEAILEAHASVWPGLAQTLRRDCTVRHLYAVQEPHAFQFLWERRLHQPTTSIEALGRPVLGGGLRFFMPNRSDNSDDPAVEVKIESLFADPSQLFVECSFVWGQPLPNAVMDPRMLVESVEDYINDEVTRFILAEE